MGEGGGYHGGFFVIELLGQSGFGALAGFFGFGFVDVFSANSHVGHDRDAFASDLDEAFAYRQEIVAPIFARDDFARNNLGHQRHMLGEDAHFAFGSRQRDHLDVLGIGLGVG